MRLLDQISQTSEPLHLRDDWGKVVSIDAMQRAATVIANCPLRYVLDTVATVQCKELVFNAKEMFTPEDTFLRVPSETFWIEWFLVSDHDETSFGALNKMGALVEADASGRRGRIELFWTSPKGPQPSEAILRFDLDKAPLSFGSEKRFTRIRHAELHHLNDLLRRVRVDLRPEWKNLTAEWPESDCKQLTEKTAFDAWPAFPMILAFSAMLNSGDLLDERSSDLKKLNSARAKSKRPALLEHTEVGMRLGYSQIPGFGTSLAGARNTPRLHYVRGHLVRRGGQTFWRTSHLRGDLHKPMLQKTIRMDGRRLPSPRT